MLISDTNILAQLKRGEESAFRYIYDNYYELLCRVSYSFVKDKFSAETIVGDVIFHLWEKREFIHIEISLKAYLLRAVRNSSINHLNQEYIQRESISLSEALDTIELNSPQTPMESLLDKEFYQQVKKAIESIPNDSKLIFKLSRYEGLSYKEIAEQRGISINTVKYHLKNALAILSKSILKTIIIMPISIIWIFF